MMTKMMNNILLIALSCFLLHFEIIDVSASDTSISITDTREPYDEIEASYSEKKKGKENVMSSSGYRFEELRDTGSRLFEGDIVIDRDTLKAFYGEEVANKVERAGLLRKAEILAQEAKSQAVAAEGVEKEAEKKVHEQKHHQRKLALMETYKKLWKTRGNDGKINVAFDILDTISEFRQDVIISALKEIEIRTKVITFTPRRNEKDYIYFQNIEQACWSHVGRQGGKQIINVADLCPFGSIIHEVLHALGFFHEQSRVDRDDYVTVDWDNISAGYEFNFFKMQTNSLGDPYDYSSIMHYPSTAFGNSEWSCDEKNLTDTAFQVYFERTWLDSGTRYCLSVKSGKKGIKDGQSIYLQPCLDGKNIENNQVWLIQKADTSNNIIRLASNPSFCATVKYQPYVVEKSPIVLMKCNSASNFKNQKFVVQQNDWKTSLIRWQAAPNFTWTRKTKASSKKTYGIELILSGTDNWENQVLGFTLLPLKGFGKSSMNTFCSFTGSYATTIDSKGNEIGIRVLSDHDIYQLQLLYQCESGPRNASNFCSIDCKCSLNQGNCSSDDQCKEGLMCKYDDLSAIRKCIEKTSAPSKSPSKSPTTRPTLSPTLPCNYSTSIKCKSDSKCIWKMIGKKYKCLLKPL